MRDWLMTLPCVMDRRVIVDVRGPWPVAFIGFRAKTVTCKEDMFMFVAENLD